MKKPYLILIGVLVLIVIVVLVNYLLIPGPWGDTPTDDSQQEIINKAKVLYNQKKSEGMQFNSQCLGVISGVKGDYVVDIVHVPRSDEDNLIENQCEAYRNKEVSNFIELDKDGNIVRIVD